jgi:hypothetical protein
MTAPLLLMLAADKNVGVLIIRGCLVLRTVAAVHNQGDSDGRIGAVVAVPHAHDGFFLSGPLASRLGGKETAERASLCNTSYAACAPSAVGCECRRHSVPSALRSLITSPMFWNYQ